MLKAAATEGNQLRTAVHLSKKRPKIRVVPYVNLRPVVQARSFEMFVVYAKAQGMDQVKPYFRSGAESRDVSGICRYLGLVENHMKARILKDPMLDPPSITRHSLVPFHAMQHVSAP